MPGNGGGIGWALIDDMTHAEVKEETIINHRHYHTIKEVKNGEGPHPIKTSKVVTPRPRCTGLCCRTALCTLSVYDLSGDPTKTIAEPGVDICWLR